MGVIKRNKTVSFNSSDDSEAVDQFNESSITFNRFMNNRSTITESIQPTFSNPVIVSSEDEQLNDRANDNLLDFIESELRRTRKSPKKRKIVRAQQSFVCLGVKGKSDKKRKRYDNANLLTNPYLKHLINDVDLYKELDIFDFVPKSVSPFALLLTDQNNMKAWNEFVNLSEEEQETLINELDEAEKPRNRFKKEVSQPIEIKPSLHRQGGKKCFDKINNCIKSSLSKKRIPLSLLESIEQELLLHFGDDPTSIYQTCLDSSYARLLLHACAQYYDLNCRSYDKAGDRWSQVSNKLDYFEPTIVSLTDHLEKLYLKSASISVGH